MSTSSKEYKVADQQKESYNMLVSLVIKTYYFWLISDTVLNNEQTLLCTGSRFHTAMHQVETGRTATDATTIVLWEWSFWQEGQSGHAGRLHPGPWAHWERPGPVPAVGQGLPSLFPPYKGERFPSRKRCFCLPAKHKRVCINLKRIETLGGWDGYLPSTSVFTAMCYFYSLVLQHILQSLFFPQDLDLL